MEDALKYLVITKDTITPCCIVHTFFIIKTTLFFILFYGKPSKRVHVEE